jgi:hypothetical protein
MNKWAVVIVDLFHSEVFLEFIQADTWYEALKLHSKVIDNIDMEDWISGIGADSLEKMKDCFFDTDLLFEIKELP